MSQPTSVVPNPDTDGDRIPDVTDRCPTTPGGPFDFNGNGCPGIYPEIKPDFRPLAVVSGRRPVILLRLVIADVSPGAQVRLQSRSIRETLTAGSDGKVKSKRFRNRKFRVGTLVKVRIVKAGFIGYFATLKVQNRVPVLRRVGRRLCIPAVGTATPTRCNRVDRGK